MHPKQVIKTIFSDRGYLIATLALIAVAITTIIISAFQIRVSELQVPIRYTSFGITNFYRDKWYYLLGFVVFIIFTAILHILISTRLYETKGREFAVAFIWLSTLVLIISAVFIYAILRVFQLSQ